MVTIPRRHVVGAAKLRRLTTRAVAQSARSCAGARTVRLRAQSCAEEGRPRAGSRWNDIDLVLDCRKGQRPQRGIPAQGRARTIARSAATGTPAGLRASLRTGLLGGNGSGGAYRLTPPTSANAYANEASMIRGADRCRSDGDKTGAQQ